MGTDRLRLIVVLVYASFVISYGLNYIPETYIDLPSFHFAAEATFERGESPYDPAALARAQESSDSGQTLFPFLHPPPSLLALYPLSFVSLRAAGLLTLFLNHLLILVFVYLFGKILEPRNDGTFCALALVYVFLFDPIVQTLERGQVNLLVLVCICIAWYALKHDRHPAWTALPLSLAVLIKAYPGVFLLYLAVKRKYRELGWCVGFLAVFSLVAWLVLPTQLWTDWFNEVLPTGGYGLVPLNLFSPAAPFNQSINGFTARLFLPNEFSEIVLASPAAARIVPAVLAVAVLLATLGLCRRGRPGRPGDAIDMEFSLVLLTMYLIAPVSWLHHIVFLLPAAILALHRVLGERKDAFRWAVLVALVVLALRLPVWAELLKRGLLTFAISIKFYAVVCIWVFCAWEMWRSGRAGAPATVRSSAPSPQP